MRKRNGSNLSGDLRFDTEQDAAVEDDGIETIDEEAELLNFKRGKKRLKMPSTDKSQLGKKGRRLLKKMQFRNGVVPAPPRPIQLDLRVMGRNKSVGRMVVSESAHATIEDFDGPSSATFCSNNAYKKRKNEKHARFIEPPEYASSKRTSEMSVEPRGGGAAN